MGYDFSAPTRFDRLFTGIATGHALRPAGLPDSHAGYENLGPDDTYEAEYARLLDPIYVKWVASPSGIDGRWNAPTVVASPGGTVERWTLEMQGFSELRRAA